MHFSLKAVVGSLFYSFSQTMFNNWITILLFCLSINTLEEMVQSQACFK